MELLDYVEIGILLSILYITHLLIQIRAQGRETLFMVKQLLEHEGVIIGQAIEPSDRVKELARSKGAEVEAIRAYREQTGLGLKEARAVVQAITRSTR